MTDIVDKKPKHKMEAHVQDDALHMVDTLGPQQLISAPGQPAIGQRHTTTLDIVKMEDVERFMAAIHRQQSEMQEQIVKMNEQKDNIEKLGANEVGPQLDELISSAKAAAEKTGKKNAWTTFQRKIFKEKPLAATFSQWQLHKKLIAQIAQAETQLATIEVSITTIDAALEKHGQASS